MDIDVLRFVIIVIIFIIRHVRVILLNLSHFLIEADYFQVFELLFSDFSFAVFPGTVGVARLVRLLDDGGRLLCSISRVVLEYSRRLLLLSHR